MFLDGGRPNDERGFIHKKLIRAVGGAVKGFVSGGPLGAVAGGLSGFARPKARAVAPRSQTARPSLAGQQARQSGLEAKFDFTPLPLGRAAPALRSIAPPSGMVDECRPGTVPDPQGRGFCIAPCSPLGRKEGLCPENGRVRERGPAGVAVNGQFGAALEPDVMMIERSVCRRGMHLATDGLCYNKGAITNKQRLWPRGRRPLLTGGDMRAISIAARAGAKLDRTTKRLRTLGMMKRLPAPKRAPHAHAKPVAAVSV